jgi:TPR repeat protein
MRHMVFALALTMTLVSAAVAGPFEDADAAYQRGDYATALRLWRPLAEQGSANAQYVLGIMYANGRGVPQNDVQAHMWFNLAASRAPASERDEAIKMRNVAASNMTPEQIGEAQRLAQEWKPK